MVSQLLSSLLVAASITSTQLDSLYNDDKVVTDVSFIGLATEKAVSQAKAEAVSESKSYTDSKTEGVITTEAVDNILAQSNLVSQTQMETAIGTATEDMATNASVDEKDKKVLSDAKSYTDGKADILTTDVSSINSQITEMNKTIDTKANASDVYTKKQVDDKDTTTLTSAKSYTDEKVRSIVIPEVPVTSVNAKVGDVVLSASDVGTYTKEQIDDKVAAAKPSDYDNVAALAKSAIQTEVDPTVPSWAKATTKPSYTADEVGALADTTTHLSGDVPTTRKVNNKALNTDITLTASDVGALPSTTTHLSGDVPTTRKINGKALSSDITLSASDVGALTSSTTHLSGDVPTSRKVNGHALTADVTVSASDVGAYTTTEIDTKVEEIYDTVDGKADSASVYSRTAADDKFYPKSEGELWSSWWSGDDFRVTVTNYDVRVTNLTPWERLPWAKFEYKTEDLVGNTNYLRAVWDESTRWNRFLDSYSIYTNAVDDVFATKASLAWGKTTPTGFDAPEGYTWVDTPAVVISGGLAYQKTITSEGAIWVLCSNGMQLETSGTETNGFFKIMDDEGNSVFEVVKGDKRTVGATAGDVSTWQVGNITHLRVVYNIESQNPPVLQVSRTLDNGGTWYNEDDANGPANFEGWIGQSGAWTNAVYGKVSEPSLFVKATYEVGGDTYIKNSSPVSMETIMLGGKKYSLGTATISGNTVLTLTEVN